MLTKLLVLIAILIILFFPDKIFAQCVLNLNASITGDTCVKGTLKVNSNIIPTSIVWKLGDSIIATQLASIQNNGTIIAGGNGSGSAANQLSYPDRMFVDSSGDLYIPDLGNARIQKWSPGAVSGITVAGGNGIGWQANQFDRPTSVFVDRQKNIYVTDQNNRRIQKWAPGATSGVTIAGGFLSILTTPTDVYLDANNNMYVSDQYLSNVIKYPPGSAAGVVVAGGNGYGNAPNQLSSPTGIAVDAQGNIYICDTDNDRIQKWAPGATTGITVAGGNGYGPSSSQLANPLSLFLDCKNNLYIADFNNQRVQKWAPGATSGVTIVGNGSFANQLSGPIGISKDLNDNLIVGEFYNSTVKKYIATINNTIITTAPGNYTATVSSTCCSVTTDTFRLTPKIPQISISANTNMICPKTDVTFTAVYSHAGPSPGFQWKKNGANTGTNSFQYIESNPLNSDVISCVLSSNDNCAGPAKGNSNTINIELQIPAPSVNLGADLFQCYGTAIILNAHSYYASYKWQDNTTDSVLNVTRSGVYSVLVHDSCGNASSDTIKVTFKDCSSKAFHIPNAFSPNNDGNNDIFKPFIRGNIIKYQFSVFNRFGQRIFNTNDTSSGWDGKVNGRLQPSDTFVWICNYQYEGETEKNVKGSVMLLR